MGHGHLRERYNAKARQSGLGYKKKARRTKTAAGEEGVPGPHADGGASAKIDSNADVIVPKTEEEKERERKEKMKAQLIAESESKWNSKKKKRLEKYIDKKLKQEERVHLFEKLAKTQTEVSNTFQLQSSATLGTRKATTHQDALAKEEDQEIRRAFDSRPGKRRRLNNVTAAPTDEDLSSDGEDILMRASRSPSRSRSPATATSAPTIIVAAQPSQPHIIAPKPVKQEAVVGGALKRNADGTPVAPKKREAKAKFQSWKHTGRKAAPTAQEDSDASFDSSDSAYDSSEEDQESDAEGGEHEMYDEDADGSEGDEESSEEESEEDDEPAPPNKRKSLGFKDWAIQQLNASKGYTAPTESPQLPDDPASITALPPPTIKKRKREGPQDKQGPLGETLVLPTTSFASQLPSSSTHPTAKFVQVNRPPEVQEARLQLPVVAEEQPIMEAIRLHPVVVLCGETGSGKTTQVPQFLYEAGFASPDGDDPGLIGVTQPRRVAAMAMARRVGHELGLDVAEDVDEPQSGKKNKKAKKNAASEGAQVAYQIRYDATTGPATRIKFMTDGVLLRELAVDFLLSRYSVVIIDEAHERSMNTDILIGVLSRVVRLREQMWKDGKDGVKPLRLIIMSATLRVSDFAENTTLFPAPPPVISVPARQHPVTVHFSRRTQPDYVSEAIKKTVKIHTRLPPGGVLVFLTGQNEITGVCKKLEAQFGAKALEERRRRRGGRRGARNGREADKGAGKEDEDAADVLVAGTSAAHADVEAENVDLGDSNEDLAADVDGDADQDMDDPEALDTDDEDELDKELGIDANETEVPMHIVPLYALLPSERQMEVFKPPPAGARLVVVATNVAETSLTIPNIRYVVDCGRAKERRYDPSSGVQAFPVSWTSKASAAQRAGRAGRTGPGHCYRLYSSALFEHHFPQFAEPEVLRAPVDGLVLQMKAMHIDTVAGFPFPTPPDRLALARAERVLTRLGAVSAGVGAAEGRITDLGRTMALFPLTPRFARMLASGGQHGCMPYIICLVSALSIGDPFLHDEALVQDEDEDEDQASFRHLTSAAAKAKEVRRLRRKAYYEKLHIYGSTGSFTSDLFKTLSVVGAYEYAGGGHQFCAENFVRPKAMEEIHKLRAQLSHIVQGDFPDVDAGFSAKLKPPSEKQLKILRQLLTAGFIDQVAIRKDRIDAPSGGAQFTTCKGVPYRAVGISEDVFIHPSSVTHDHRPPEFVVFNEVVRTSRVWLKGVTIVNPAWLASLGKGSMCTFSKPRKNRAGEEVVVPHFGPDGWELPLIKAALVA